jgi:hypothetical protein
MASFAQSNVTLSVEKEHTIVFELTKILLWYRPDFFKNKNSIPALIYTCLLLEDDTDQADLILQFFDLNESLKDKKPEMNKDGLMKWDKEHLDNLLKIKKGKKMKIKWKVYNWGTNSA